MNIQYEYNAAPSKTELMVSQSGYDTSCVSSLDAPPARSVCVRLASQGKILAVLTVVYSVL